MLIDFTAENFKSIREAQTLSLLATQVKEHPEAVTRTPEGLSVLKSAVIYGANGSGKSNVLDALGTLLALLRPDPAPERLALHYAPFRLDRQWAGRPTALEAEFVGHDGIRYRYRLAYTAAAIVEEGLWSYPKKQEVRLFFREAGKGLFWGAKLKGGKKALAQQLAPHEPLLAVGARQGHAQLAVPHQSLLGIMLIDTSQTRQLVDQAVRYASAQRNDELLSCLNRLLCQANTGVARLAMREVALPEAPWQRRYEPMTAHPMYDGGNRVGEAYFHLAEESRGTQQLYGLGAALFAALLQGRTICIDELDLAFHPLMTAHLVGLFRHPRLNQHQAQLIFSTHDTSMLQPGLFRRDQIWFAEKNIQGATSLYALSEFDADKVRANVPFDRWYLSGKFGALPVIEDMDWDDAWLDGQADAAAVQGEAPVLEGQSAREAAVSEPAASATA
jgi:hypothetical protein